MASPMPLVEPVTMALRCDGDAFSGEFDEGLTIASTRLSLGWASRWTAMTPTRNSRVTKAPSHACNLFPRKWRDVSCPK